MDHIRVNESSTSSVSFYIVDSAGAAVPAAQLTTAALTLYDLDTYEPDGSPIAGILNSRNAQDVLNVNDVTINSSGHVVWTMAAEDNPIVTERRQVERHRAMFRFAWSGGKFTYELEIEVVNMRGVMS